MTIPTPGRIGTQSAFKNNPGACIQMKVLLSIYMNRLKDNVYLPFTHEPGRELHTTAFDMD